MDCSLLGILRAIDDGAAIDAKDHTNLDCCALHATCYKGDFPSAKLLLSRGAEPCRSNQMGLTPHQLALSEGRATLALTALFTSRGLRTAAHRHLRCYVNHSNAGFFAQVQFVLHQALEASCIGLEPVAYISYDSLDGPNGYYCAAKGENIWEYFFQPLGCGQYENAWRSTQREPGAQLLLFKSAEIWRLHLWNDASVFTYPYGSQKATSFAPNEQLDLWFAQMRARGAAAVAKFVRTKPHILETVS